MNLNEYLSSVDSATSLSAASLAKKLDVPSPLVSQWKTGARPIPIERCPAIESATSGAVTRRDLRPDDWWLIWPELITDDHPVPKKVA